MPLHLRPHSSRPSRSSAPKTRPGSRAPDPDATASARASPAKSRPSPPPTSRLTTGAGSRRHGLCEGLAGKSRPSPPPTSRLTTGAEGKPPLTFLAWPGSSTAEAASSGCERWRVVDELRRRLVPLVPAGRSDSATSNRDFDYEF